MTITHANATGVTTSTGARGTSSTTVPYISVSAGRIAVIFAQCKPTTASWSTVTGWTQIADVTGGTGSDGVDTGPTRLGAWYRILDGSETGSITVATTGGTNVTTVMHVMSKSLANWAVPIAVSGSDAAHGTNFSATMGTWAQSLTAGDYVLIGHSSDTDDTQAISAPTLSQSGAGFGTVTARNRLGNSDGNGGIITSWSASVSTGNANAPTFGFTWAASSCGPAIAVRLHEYSPMSALVDDFNDNSVAAPPWSGNYGSASETGGRAHVPTTATYAGYQTGYYYAFDQFSTQVPVVPSLGGATVECYVSAWVVSADQDAGTHVGFFCDRTTGNIYFASRVGYVDPSPGSVTYNSTTHAWWRLRISGANLLWETSTDGNSWTQQRSVTTPAWLSTDQSCKLLLESHRNNGTDDYAEFDNVNVPPAFGATALTAASGLTAGAVATISAAAALTAAAGLTAAAVREQPAAAALSAASGISGTAVAEIFAAATLAAATGLAVAGIPVRLAAVALSAATELSAAGILEAIAVAALTAGTTFAAAGANASSVAAALTAASALSAAPLQGFAAAVLLTASTGLTGQPWATRYAVATLTAASGLTATGSRQFSAAVLLAAAAGLSSQPARNIPALAEMLAISHLLAGALSIQQVFAYPHGITFVRGLGTVSRTDLALSVRRTI